MKIIFATNNQHKLKEIREMCGSRFSLLSLSDVGLTGEIPEEHETLEENALSKARYIFERTGIPTFADDTGLEVEALDGKPGVFSARYAGPDKDDKENVRKILSELKDNNNRKARFRTVIAFIHPDGEEKMFEGIVNGVIGEEPRGDHGFGYDPVFIPEGFTTTFAEMDGAVKNRITHRSRAFSQFIKYLNEHFIKEE